MKKYILILTLLFCTVVYGATRIGNTGIAVDGTVISNTAPAGSMTLDSGSGGLILTDLTATTVPYLGASKEILSSAVTPTELGYVGGVTSAIQTQFTNHLADTSTHGATGDIVGTTGVQILSTKTIDLPLITTGMIMSNQAYLNFRELGSVNYVGFKAPASLSVNTDYILPSADGSTGEFLQTDGSANLDWSNTLTSPVLNTAVSGTAVLDEDTLVSDSDTQLATQQSIKAYADGRTAKATLTTKGDIYGATAASTPARLGVGSNGQVLTAASGQATGMEWATPSSSSVNLVVTTKTTTYTILTSDDVILGDTSSAGFTLTLPTAVGNTGKVFQIKYTDSGFANALTVDGNGAETIDGSTTTTLDTQNESLKIISDGTNWEILDRKIPSAWTSYSPTGTYSGEANATYNGYWKRVGDSILLRLEIDFTGTVAALGVMSFDTPSGLTFDTAKLSANFKVSGNFPELGTGGAFESGVAAHQVKLTYADTNTLHLYSGTVSTSVRNDDNVDHNSPAVWGTSDAITVSSYEIPISGWNE